MPYDIKEHTHRYAAWAASRAASVTGCRFSVEIGRTILETSGMKEVGRSLQGLPAARNFDETHRKWRKDVINCARREGKTFSHGVAAKLINVYLKTIFVVGNHRIDRKVKAIHPPIDSLLLEALYRENRDQQVIAQRGTWAAARRVRWSRLDSNDYEAIIEAIRNSVNQNDGLWKIEKYWQGYQ